ncbi:substrate-binding periplasmic protein [Roseateles sp. BYS78W]|uniref:Substrate-binding periplasmic protein n=1 Tax=Pelomonas candidula TaxID=3299025 RepID=A0ABW7HCN2_9BURK
MLRRDLLLLSVPAGMPAPVKAQQHPNDAAERTPPLEWVAGDLPPFAWRAPGGARGYAHDLMLLMARQLGRPAQVTYYPWARAVQLTERSDHVGIFPLARTPDREKRFQWLVPLMTTRYVLVTTATERRLVLSQLRLLRVGVLRGSPIVRNLQGEHFQTIIEGKDYKDLLRMLVGGTLDAVYAGASMIEAAMDEYGYARQRFTTHLALGEAKLYMAASLALAPEEARRWQKAYQQLEEDGSVERLRRRYFAAEKH